MTFKCNVQHKIKNIQAREKRLPTAIFWRVWITFKHRPKTLRRIYPVETACEVKSLGAILTAPPVLKTQTQHSIAFIAFWYELDSHAKVHQLTLHEPKAKSPGRHMGHHAHNAVPLLAILVP